MPRKMMYVINKKEVFLWMPQKPKMDTEIVARPMPMLTQPTFNQPPVLLETL